jgi:protein-disulfide isomerase
MKNQFKMSIWLICAFIFASGNFACSDSTQTQPAAKGATQTAKSNDQVAEYVRKAFNVPSAVKIAIKDEKPSNIPGLNTLQIEFTTDRGPQVQQVWITEDHNKMIWGRMLDLTVDPYKEVLSKISMNNVPVKGPTDAKVTIVEYTDFQCPYCSKAHTNVQELLKTYDGKIKIVYKSLPLSIHNWAEDAAVVGTCAYQQNPDALWKYADFFFDNQKTVTKETLEATALDLGKQWNLDVASLKQCMDAKATMPIIEADVKEAQALGFNSTPSFVVNGRSVIGAVPLDQFKQVIDEALAAQ